jgi:hypothetical protein
MKLIQVKSNFSILTIAVKMHTNHRNHIPQNPRFFFVFCFLFFTLHDTLPKVVSIQHGDTQTKISQLIHL